MITSFLFLVKRIKEIFLQILFPVLYNLLLGICKMGGDWR